MAVTNVVVQLTHYSFSKDVVCSTSKVSKCLKNWGDSILRKTRSWALPKWSDFSRQEPSEQVKNVFKPKSNPAILPVVNLISGSSILSTTTTINNSPNGVRLMVRVLILSFYLSRVPILINATPNFNSITT